MMVTAQAAFEYMVIVAIVVAFIIPIWSYVGSVQTQSSIELSLSYAKNAAEKLVETADVVYSQGPPAKVKLKLYIPKYVEAAEIMNHTVIFRVRTLAGLTDVHPDAESTALLNGTLPTAEGTYWVSIEAVGDVVQIY
jgi:hypothetical protein